MVHNPSTPLNYNYKTRFICKKMFQLPKIVALSASVNGAQPSINPVLGLGSKGLFPLIHWQDELYFGISLSITHAVLGKSLQ